MRKKIIALNAVIIGVIILLSSCHHRHHNTSIHLKETGSVLQLNASYNENKTRRVMEYLDERIAKNGDASFVNSEMDATITLNDETRFYIKSHPGFLKIKFNKNENSEEAYYKMKDMCQGIKQALK